MCMMIGFVYVLFLPNYFCSAMKRKIRTVCVCILILSSVVAFIVLRNEHNSKTGPKRKLHLIDFFRASAVKS